MHDSDHLPESVHAFFDAVNSRDKAGLCAVLDQKIALSDGSRTVSGVDAVTDWFGKWIEAPGLVIEADTFFGSEDGRVVVQANIHGSFDESGRPQPVPSTYTFTLVDGRITALAIHLPGGNDSLAGMIRDITIGELSRTREQIDAIYQTELQKLAAWEAEAPTEELKKEIDLCTQALQQTHLIAEKYVETASAFIQSVRNGVGNCMREAWPRLISKRDAAMDKKNRLLMGEAVLKESRAREERHVALLFDEIDRPGFKSLADVAERLQASLPEGEQLSFKMTAASVAVQLNLLISALKINFAIIQLGNIWRSFLYAHVIENYGDRLRKDEQEDALSELLQSLVGRFVPNVGDATDVANAVKKLGTIRNRVKHVPALFSEMKKQAEYFSAYRNTLKLLGVLLHSYSEAIKSSHAAITHNETAATAT